MATHLKAVNAANNRRSTRLNNSINSKLSIFADRRADNDRRKNPVPAETPSNGCRRNLNRRDRTNFTHNWWLHTNYVEWEE